MVLPGSATSGVQSLASHEMPSSRWDVQGHLSDEVQRGVAADPALLDGETRVLPAEDLSGEVGIRQALFKE
jgi:hypothetical protein